MELNVAQCRHLALRYEATLLNNPTINLRRCFIDILLNNRAVELRGPDFTSAQVRKFIEYNKTRLWRGTYYWDDDGWFRTWTVF